MEKLSLEVEQAMAEHATQPAPRRDTREEWTPPPQGRWTYEDYARLPDVEGYRYEVIEGNIYMSPAPRITHQRAVGRLYAAMFNHVEKHDLGEVLVAPVDVLMEDLATPVQPDILFFSNERRSILTPRNIQGAPNLLVEVLSPGREGYDWRTKFDVYQRAGVPEYWIVDPDNRRIKVFVQRGEKQYVGLGVFAPTEDARSEVMRDFRVSVEWVCPAP